MVRFDSTTRSKARASLRRLAESCEGPRLSRRRRRRLTGRGLLRAFVGIAGFFAALATIAVLALTATLSRGPIDLDVLHDRIVGSMQERAGDRYQVVLGPMFLMRDDEGIGIGFGGISIRDAQGRTVISAPRGRIGLDPLAALALEVRVRRLELDGLDLRLRVAKDGALSIAASGDADAKPIALPGPRVGGDGAPATLARLVQTAIDRLAGASQSLDRLALAHGHLEVDNEAQDKTIVYDDFAIHFAHSGDQATVAVSARGKSGPWSAIMKAESGDTRALSVEAHDLSYDDLRTFDSRPPPFQEDTPLSFVLDARLLPNQTIETLTGRFELGAGHIKFEDPDAEPLLIDEASGGVHWDPAEQRLSLDDLQILAGATRLTGRGWARAPDAGRPSWTFHLGSNDIQFDPERVGDRPVTLTDLSIDAHFTPATSAFVVDELSAQGPTVNLKLHLETMPEAGGSTFKVMVQAGRSHLLDVVRLWPQFISRDVRDWCAQHIRSGELASAAISIDWDAAQHEAATHKRPVPRESVHGEFVTHDVALVDLQPGVPAVGGLDGVGAFTGRDANVSAKRGVIELSASRKIQVSDVSFIVPDTAPAPIVPAQASARFQGSADAMSELLNRDAFRRFAVVALDPATTRGQFDGKLDLDIKMGKAARPEDSQFHVAGALTNLRIDKFLANEPLEQATLTVDADRAGLKIVGDGTVFGAATHIEIAKGQSDEGSATLTFLLDAAARAKRGLDFGPWFKGSVPVKLKAPLSRASADIELDLTKVAIDNPLPGLSKPAGRPGKATFILKQDGEGAALSNIVVDAGAISLRGSAQIGADGTLQSAKLTQARYSPTDDLKVDVLSTSALVKISVRGTSLDARPFTKALFAHGLGPGGGGKDLDLDMKIGNVLGANKISLASLDVSATRRGGHLASLGANARIGAGVLRVESAQAGQIRLHSSDAGAVFRFADLYSHLEGGSLDLVTRERGEANDGYATVADFVLRDEPAMRQLIAAGQAGTSKSADIDPNAAHFQKMTVSFTTSPGKMEVKDAVIYDERMGLTAQGFLDFDNGLADLNGTFIPAYQLNTLLNKIPLFGALLLGGANEGVIGVSYRVHGPIASPGLTINPLSAIAPGILRKILGVIDGTGARSPPTPPANDQ